MRATGWQCPVSVGLRWLFGSYDSYFERLKFDASPNEGRVESRARSRARMDSVVSRSIWGPRHGRLVRHTDPRTGPDRPVRRGAEASGRVSFWRLPTATTSASAPASRSSPRTPRSGGITVVDPGAFTDDLFVEVDTAAQGTDHVVIPPNSFALCETVEGWRSRATSWSSASAKHLRPLRPDRQRHAPGRVEGQGDAGNFEHRRRCRARVYANEGIAQMVFLKADRVCAVSYADKAGKYQGQVGLTLPKVD